MFSSIVETIVSTLNVSPIVAYTLISFILVTLAFVILKGYFHINIYLVAC